MIKRILLAAAAFVSLANAAQAACSTPTANAGAQFYNTTVNAMQYCNGTTWVNMGMPSGSVGTLVASNFCTSDGTIINCTTPSITNAMLAGSIDLTSKVTGVLPATSDPALTGDVTKSAGSAATTIATDAVTTAKILNANVTNAKLANMAANTIKGNNTGGAAAPLDLTVAQATAMLNAVVGDSGAGGTKGLVPAPASGDAAANKFLKADGTWTAVSGAPSGTAGGDLSGTYPNPTVAKINTVALGTTTATGGNLLIGNGTAWVSNAVTGDVTINSSGVTAIGPNKVTRGDLAQGAARSVIGVTGNATSDPADITGTANQVLRVNSGGTALAFGAIDLSSSAAATGLLQAASFPILTGDVTTAGGALATTIANNAVTSAKINDGAVTNAKLASFAAAGFKGATAAGAVTDLTAAQATSILSVMQGDGGAGGTKGLVPAQVSGDAAKFLRGDGTWATAGAAPSGTAGYVQISGGSTLSSSSTSAGNQFFWDSTNHALGIGTATPSTKAVLDMTSTTKGFLPPRMTSTQRD